MQRASINAFGILALQAAQNFHSHLLWREAQRNLFASVDTDLRRKVQHALARRLGVRLAPGPSFDRRRSGCSFTQDAPPAFSPLFLRLRLGLPRAAPMSRILFGPHVRSVTA